MFEDIKNKEVKFYDFHTPAAKDLISRLLVKDPDERLNSPEEIMQHDFYHGVKWDELMLR
jgi:serine/threonine protein kinase